MTREPSNRTRIIQAARAPLLALVLTLFAGATLAAEPANGKITTNWAGTTKARCGPLTTDHSRCNAVQNIKLSFVQEGSAFTGSYTCAYGNQTCRGAQTTGTVTEGSLKGEQVMFVVTTPDKSTCRYSGVLTNRSGRGSYSCIGGSQLNERGTWRIHASE